jgi:modulator of FtsH protease
MHAADIKDWAGFFSAEAGAAASLAGLVIVAISINLARILAFPQLPGRAIETLALLVGVLLVSSVGLVPGQSMQMLGGEILVIGCSMWGVGITAFARGSGAPVPGKRWARALRLILGQLATVPFVVAGIAVFVSGASGLYWTVPGTIFCLIAGVMNAWVLLVEVVR